MRVGADAAFSVNTPASSLSGVFALTMPIESLEHRCAVSGVRILRTPKSLSPELGLASGAIGRNREAVGNVLHLSDFRRVSRRLLFDWLAPSDDHPQLSVILEMERACGN